MSIDAELFQRTELLLGKELMSKVKKTRIIIFGIGGVGSWCVESLARSGVGHITLVDSDLVAASNINRQLLATTQTIGQVKVDVLQKRLLTINPNMEVEARQEIYSAETSASFNLDSYDYIIDAIDSLQHKVHLICAASKTKATLFSSMGAALKIDPSRIQVAEFWKVKGCPLAAALRRKIKQGEKPARKFFCVFSDEVLENKEIDLTNGGEISAFANDDIPQGNAELAKHDWNKLKAQINGTFVHITAIFGFRLAGLVMQDICKKHL